MTVTVREIPNGCLVQICRPERKGALNVPLLSRLLTIFSERTDENIVLTGSEQGFCSGLDLKDMAMMSIQEKKQMNALYGEVLQAWVFRRGHKLVFLNGPAIGGGVGWVLASDYVVATQQSWLCLPELSKGMQPVQIHQLLLSRLGPTNALAWLSGMKIDLAMGLMHGMVQEATVDQLEQWLEVRYPNIVLAHQFMKSMEGRSDWGVKGLSELFV